jgi:hypothetical protein
MNNDRFKTKPDVWVSTHPDGAAMLDPDTGLVFVCNEVGATVWSGLSEGLSVDAIADGIARTFKVPPNRAKRDILKFTADLKRHGLLTGRSEPQ